MKKFNLPKSTVATLTLAGIAALSTSTLSDIDSIALGTSTDEPSVNDLDLGNKVVSYPVAVSTSKDGKLTVHAALEYGTLLGVHEIGLYAGDKLLMTLNSEINRTTNEPLITMQYRNVYLLDITLDIGQSENKNYFAGAHAVCTERKDITLALALWQQSIAKYGCDNGPDNGSSNNGPDNGSNQDAMNVPRPTRTGQVLVSEMGMNGALECYWTDLINVHERSQIADTANEGFNEWGISSLYNLTYNGNTLKFLDLQHHQDSRLILAMPFEKTIETEARRGCCFVNHEDYNTDLNFDANGLSNGRYISRFRDGDFESIEYNDGDIIQIQV
ncbi:MAG: hypothetical protein Q4P13_10360, partial [Psychrobacter sp.]|nr:hypothetical protein [Psychrobacter sp.]